MKEQKSAVESETIWAYLIHQGANLWADRVTPEWKYDHASYHPSLRCETTVWNELTEKMADAGLNMVVIDLADGIRYDSHPEIAVKRAWTVKRLKKELKRLRRLGLEPIPKLNFSAAHDTWLGPYSRCLSTEPYYQVCRDLIAEVIEIFEGPRFFHLGMDEETVQHQRFYQFVVVRQHGLWWHDLHFYLEEVRKGGSRPWVWSDYYWHYPDKFMENMPRDVLQSNWYYAERFDRRLERVKTYLDLNEAGFDQVPTGSNHSVHENLEKTVRYCTPRLDENLLLGFLQSVWRLTQECYRDRLFGAIKAVEEAKAAYETM
ncbi:MAG: Tat pathway signal protein [Planctomycetota bacterium]|nr:Tat pathway signal protein [Planctomycetota bacterium]MDP7254239.1 Tat pathway signal protein [Planctomycetota bacterium]